MNMGTRQSLSLVFLVFLGGAEPSPAEDVAEEAADGGAGAVPATRPLWPLTATR